LLDKIKDLIFKLFISGLVAIALIAGLEWSLGKIQKAPPARVSDASWDQISLSESQRPRSEAYKRYPWVLEFLSEAKKGIYRNPLGRGGMYYVPFVLWKPYSFESKYININSDGHRRTINPVKPNCNQHRLVYAFGGSTTAGDGLLRDQDTLPSQLSKILNEAYPNICIEVSNFGVSGYNQGNEYVQFMEVMANKPTADVAVIYDGFNDVFHRVISGTPHMSFAMFMFLNELWQGEQQKHLKPLIRGLANKLRLVRLFTKPQEIDFRLVDNETDVNTRAEAIGSLYADHLKVYDQFSKGSRCEVLVFLQPTLFSKAHTTKEENELLSKTRHYFPLLEKALQSTYSSIKSHVKDKSYGNRLIDVTNAIETTESVYIDPVHVSPLGNEWIAKKLASEIIKRNALKI
jgi:lysophospholipase L1-like esterase